MWTDLTDRPIVWTDRSTLWTDFTWNRPTDFRMWTDIGMWCGPIFPYVDRCKIKSPYRLWMWTDIGPQSVNRYRFRNACGPIGPHALKSVPIVDLGYSWIFLFFVTEDPRPRPFLPSRSGDLCLCADGNSDFPRDRDRWCLSKEKAWIVLGAQAEIEPP